MGDGEQIGMPCRFFVVRRHPSLAPAERGAVERQDLALFVVMKARFQHDTGRAIGLFHAETVRIGNLLLERRIARDLLA